MLIRVDRTGICGTDLHINSWDAWAQKTIPVGLVIGHELVGDVVEVGSNVAGFAPGDDYEAAFATAAGGLAGKVILHWRD